MSRKLRYLPGTPKWVAKRDYYLQVAMDAQLEGKYRKAERYRKKAMREFFRHFGPEINV